MGLTAFLGLWHIISRYLAGDGSSILPAPLQVATALAEMADSGELVRDAAASLRRISIGFLIAFVAAMSLGITAVRFARLYDYVKVIMDLFGSIPPIAWTPIAILWFGIGNAPAYFIVFLGAFFPMFLTWYSGIIGVEKSLIQAAKTLGAPPMMIVKGVILPGALPQILTGIKTGIAIAWFNVIAAELIGVRSGLGYKIQLSRTLLFSDHVLALMAVIGALGFLMTRLVAILGNLLAPWAIQDEYRSRWMQRRRQIQRWLGPSRALYQQTNRVAQLSEGMGEVLARSPAPVLEVEGLSKSFETETAGQPLQVLNDISFSVKPGELFVILGPNGSGKTTLLSMIAGLTSVDSGSIRFMGKEVSTPSPQRTMVFQNLGLFPWRTSRGNIEFALRAADADRGQWRGLGLEARALRLLGDAKLGSFIDAYPAELSGGLRQRLALVRALSVSPELILLDEPFASFDPIVRARNQDGILELLSTQAVTILLVTHDLDEAIYMADRVLVLSERPGSTKEIVDIDLRRPRTAETRRSREFQDLRLHLWELLLH